jgi:uncharacterized protein (TIGR03790 family)
LRQAKDTKNKLKFILWLFVLFIGCLSRLNADITNQTLAVLVNKNDPESIEIAKYYQSARSIPESNLIYLNFKPNINVLTEVEFKQIEDQLKAKVTNNIQAYALAWRKPWRVGCMSITSAISLGFSEDYCARGCKLTKSVEYFTSDSRQPYIDYKIRPSMLLSANSIEGVKRLIDRGVSADFDRPLGTAYLLSTSDKHRNVRARNYPIVNKVFGHLLNIDILKTDVLTNKKDVMFYFTGLNKVEKINTNRYLPGAVADHLTSTGGELFGGNQMSVLKWIDSGVTGTYGAVVEPCNYLQKFPRPLVVMQKYLSGDTLLEAYWKSVQMPGQGVFVGEPLASPYKNCKMTKNIRGSLQYFRLETDNFVERKAKNCN